mgnify:CR=1 FL=1
MKKIMFNDRYVLTKAVLEGKKTQTRRVVPKDFFSLNWDVKERTLVYENDFGDFVDIRNSKYALFHVGEIVAVAQKYNDCGGVLENGIPRWKYISKIVGNTSGGWTNKMFVKPELMPHQIRITDVRVERLQDISDEDCLKEGISPMIVGCEYYVFSFIDKEKGRFLDYKTPREAYAALIDKVSGKGTWESNPYVFVYDFELIK